MILQAKNSAKNLLILAVAGSALVACSSSNGGSVATGGSAGSTALAGGTSGRPGGNLGSGGVAAAGGNSAGAVSTSTAAGGASAGGGSQSSGGAAGKGAGGNGGGNSTSTAAGGASSGGGSQASGGAAGKGAGGNGGGGGSTSTAAGGTQSGGGSRASGGAADGGPGGNPATGGAVASGGSAGQAAGGQSGTGGSTVTCTAPAPTGSSYAVDANGVTFTVGSSKLRVQVCKEDIIRVQYASGSSIPTKNSLSVSATWGTPSFCVTEASGTLTIATARIKAKVVESTGVVSYTDLSDNVILAEDSKSATAATVQGTSTNKVQTVFNSPAGEGLFGLGQHPDSVMNYKGGTVNNMVNSNGSIQIPMLVSSKGYGIFWDNYSSTSFAGNASSNTKYSFTSQAGEGVDYYFFYGPSIDQVIAGYRTTTGAPPLFAKWAYGLFQSKDHYSTQTEFLNVVSSYRNAKIPVDVVVQDWDYWGSYSWGSHIMDPKNYPNPATLVSTMHAANIHGMISIWPEYQYLANPPAAVDSMNDQDNYNALKAINALYPNPSNGSNHYFYDTFNASARTLVYQQMYDRLIGKYGWDAIWADNDEPQDYPSGSVNMSSVTTALGAASLYINAYPLQHTKAIYEGWRKVGPATKRVFALSRSAFAGAQRYGAAEWSGDINADWGVFTTQIPAGLNYAISGMPYWTTDIGGYFGTPTEELFTRWFQFGAFCSIFRIHGQAPKELYGSQWSATGKANLLAVDTLHYRLMPYLYSLAWRVTNEGYTIMRPLVFDYQSDSNVYGLKDQFMYGPAILVNPVTSAGATSRSVYLPAGTWYDFWTGSTTNGGSKVTADAPLSKIPLYVKAGSIVPMGPNIQYATESIDPLEIRVYEGQDGSFTLYEDEGDSYNYESGQHAEISFSWSDASKQLSIGARKGSYTGMPATRTFNIVWVGASHGAGVDITATADQVVKYDGSAVAVSAN